MKRCIRIFIFALVCIFGFPGAGSSADFQLNRIVDGDTLEMVTRNGERIRVNLAGIDAPEMPVRKSGKGQPFCRQARDLLAELVVNRKFSFQAVTPLAKRQVTAVVFSQGKNVNLEIIRAGYAEVCTDALPPDFDIEPYRKEEAAAKKAEKGMWALGQVYISPRKWRKANQP